MAVTIEGATPSQEIPLRTRIAHTCLEAVAAFTWLYAVVKLFIF